MSLFSKGLSRDEIVAHAPTLATHFSAFYGSFSKQPYVPLQTLELCRLRVAQLHQCVEAFEGVEYAIAAEQKDKLTEWTQCASFSAAEKACLAFAEVYCMDPSSITDEHAEAVKAHYKDAGLVVLVEALGVYYGMTRLSQMWA